MEEKNKRNGIIYLTIGVVTLLILVAGATYAYFQAQSGEGKSANLNATTGTTDTLYFYMRDIDTTSEKTVDEHNQEGEEENTDIVINASQDNFKEQGKSLSDGINARATLTANNSTKEAHGQYNVFFVIEENDLNIQL